MPQLDMDFRLSPYLKYKEVRCKCYKRPDGPYCTGGMIHPKVILVFTLIRTEVGCPITVTSGVRCKKYNAMQKGAVANSQHILGKALDLACPKSIDIDSFFAICKKHNTKGFCKLYREKGFVHIDVRNEPDIEPDLEPDWTTYNVSTT